MKGGWGLVKSWLIPDAGLPMERRFFQSLCILGGVVSIFVVVPMNSIQNLSPWVNRVVFTYGVVSLALGWAARWGHYLKGTMICAVTACLDLVWFANGGSQGSIGLFFFSVALFVVLFTEGRARYLVLGLLLADVFGLHLTERAWPQLVHPFNTATDRLLDLLTGYALSLFICALMLWVVLEGFRRERIQLAESEGMYREFLEGQGEGFSTVDAQERFLMVNPVAEAIFGVGPGQLVGRSLVEFLPADQQELLRRESELRAKGHHSTYEIRIRRADGELRTLQVTATPRFGQDGDPLQVIGVFRDITERKESEDRLRESEAKFRTYIEQSIDVIFTLDAEGGFLFVSPAWERHFGIPVEEVTGKPFAPFVHPEDVQPCVEHLSRVMTTGLGETSPPYRVKHADGSWRWFRANGTRMSTPTGAWRYMGVAHDITERKEAEEALRESEQRYRAQFDRASVGIFTLSPEGKLLEINEAMARMHGWTQEEMLGMDVKELDTPESAVGADDRMRRLLAGEALTFEVEHFHKDGHTFPLEVSASLVPSGKRTAILCFHRDITERKRAEEAEQLLAQEKQQTQKMESLGSLAGGVAHDFNNMLGGIMGYADLLLSGELDPTRQRYLRAIVAAASRSAELTQKLLAFGRRGKNLVESLDLRGMVDDCLDMIRPSMSPDLQVVVTMDACPTVDGDPAQIHQVLVNLCINAMEAMPERGTLSLSSSVLDLPESSHRGWTLKPGKYMELAVTDTGVGMTAAVQQRIFEPFFTTKTTGSLTGSGLGLSTAYGIIHAHGGAILVSSVRGRGSTFRILRPWAPCQRQLVPVRPALPRGKVWS